MSDQYGLTASSAPYVDRARHEHYIGDIRFDREHAILFESRQYDGLGALGAGNQKN
jgi:hypothetical protein